MLDIERLIPVLLLLALNFNFSLAQKQWSLEKCIQRAINNSVLIRQGEVAIQQSELSSIANKYSRYPDLNASSSFGYSFGLTIDPTTNSFINNSAGTNTWSLNSSVVLYNGGRINNTIEQAAYDIKSAKADMQQNEYEIALGVANAYLNILLAEEQLLNATKQMELTETQLKQTEKLIQVGQLSKTSIHTCLLYTSPSPRDS